MPIAKEYLVHISKLSAADFYNNKYNWMESAFCSKNAPTSKMGHRFFMSYEVDKHNDLKMFLETQERHNKIIIPCMTCLEMFIREGYVYGIDI